MDSKSVNGLTPKQVVKDSWKKMKVMSKFDDFGGLCGFYRECDNRPTMWLYLVTDDAHRQEQRMCVYCFEQRLNEEDMELIRWE